MGGGGPLRENHSNVHFSLLCCDCHADILTYHICHACGHLDILDLSVLEMPSGIASACTKVHTEAEARKWLTDFYKTPAPSRIIHPVF